MWRECTGLENGSTSRTQHGAQERYEGVYHNFYYSKLFGSVTTVRLDALLIGLSMCAAPNLLNESFLVWKSSYDLCILRYVFLI